MTARAFTVADAAVIVVLLGCSWLLGGRGAAVARQGRHVEVVSVAGSQRYALDRDRRLEVPGPLGISVIRIRDRAAVFESSPCPQKICLRSGTLRSGGQFAACLPNRVALRVVAGSAVGEDVDAVGR